MKFSVKWLRDYINIDLSVEELSDALTFSGIEVENVEISPLAKELESVVIARVVECKPHPRKDSLYICMVDEGTEVRQVVCGAPNTRIGIKTAYIPSGKHLCDLHVKKAEIKGVLSDGMLCSEQELGLSNDHKGIIELPGDTCVGGKIVDYFELDDVTFDVEITPNRPDLLAIRGIARDISANLNIDTNFKEVKELDFYPDLTPSEHLVENLADRLCPRYLGTVINNVVIKESPLWLKKRLQAIGVKPVNNVVDISNFVMMEYGHPLHAFDIDKLSGRKIIVRKAHKGEKIEALDHRTYSLSDQELVIADSEKPVAIAGIIGGVDSSITESTTSILLETANFDYASIRKTSKKFKIFTDSSYRFERNLSSDTVPFIASKAIEMIIDLCQGKPISYQDSYPSREILSDVGLRISRTNQLLATNLTKEEIIAYLERLQLKVIDSTDERIKFSIPHFRKDLTREIDLIEEVIRLYGYNRVGQDSKVVTKSLTDKKRFKITRQITDFLFYNGFSEAINSSFTDKNSTETLKITEEDYRNSFIDIENPIGVDSSVMRTSLLPGLLKNVMLNISNGREDIKMFEIGKIYYDCHDKPEEKVFLTGVIVGNNNPKHWQINVHNSDIFSVKGIVQSLLDCLNKRVTYIATENSSYLQKGQEIKIISGEKIIGEIGKLDPLIAKKFDLQQPLYLFDINVDLILELYREKDLVYTEVVRYPEVERDISFIVSKKISHSNLLDTIKSVDTDYIKEVRLIDQFKGKNIPEDCRSLTYRLKLSSSAGTLTDNDIQQLMNNIFAKLSAEYTINKR